MRQQLRQQYEFFPTYKQYRNKVDDHKYYNRKKEKQQLQRKDYLRFETVVYQLLSQIDVVEGIQFDLKIDKRKHLHHLGTKREIPKLLPKIKESGAKSYPDAELVQVDQSSIQRKAEFIKGKKARQLSIIFDAKYYTSELKHDAYYKTVHDIQLRNDEDQDAYGILIVSEDTGLNLIDMISEEGVKEKIRIVRISTDEDLIAGGSGFIGSYDNFQNLDNIRKEIAEVVKDFNNSNFKKELEEQERGNLEGIYDSICLRPQKRKSRSAPKRQRKSIKLEEQGPIKKENKKEKKREVKVWWQEVEERAQEIHKQLKDAENDLQKLKVIKEANLKITRKNRIDCRSYLGLQVQRLEDAENAKKEAELPKVAEMEIRRSEIPEERYFGGVEVYTSIERQLRNNLEKLHNFYDDIRKSPKKLAKIVGKGSVATGLQLLGKVREILQEDYHDPFPHNPNWQPFQSSDALDEEWKPKKLAGSEVMSESYYINAPFSWPGMCTCILVKAYLANIRWGSKFVYICPFKEFSEISPEIKTMLMGEPKFRSQNIGTQVFAGYIGTTPFDIALLSFL